MFDDHWIAVSRIAFRQDTIKENQQTWRSICSTTDADVCFWYKMACVLADDSCWSPCSLAALSATNCSCRTSHMMQIKVANALWDTSKESNHDSAMRDNNCAWRKHDLTKKDTLFSFDGCTPHLCMQAYIIWSDRAAPFCSWSKSCPTPALSRFWKPLETKWTPVELTLACHAAWRPVNDTNMDFFNALVLYHHAKYTPLRKGQLIYSCYCLWDRSGESETHDQDFNMLSLNVFTTLTTTVVILLMTRTPPTMTAVS